MSDLNKYSAHITQPRSQGASQAMLFGTGMTEEDMNKPQVGISSVWYEGNTCNMHLNDLAAKVKEGVQASGLVGLRFNTIGVSDGISMGTDGMSFSLQSRDLIADSIETVMGAQWYDANISLPGCDKNMPGCLIAMGRLNRPSLMVYGGTIKPGCYKEKKLDIVSAFQAYGEYLSGAISDEERAEIVKNSCPGAGACGGMYTANTMASAIEAMGMTLPYSSSIRDGQMCSVPSGPSGSFANRFRPSLGCLRRAAFLWLTVCLESDSRFCLPQQLSHGCEYGTPLVRCEPRRPTKLKVATQPMNRIAAKILRAGKFALRGQCGAIRFCGVKCGLGPTAESCSLVVSPMWLCSRWPSVVPIGRSQPVLRCSGADLLMNSFQ